MTIHKIHIRFNLKSGDKNIKGLSPIRCRLTYNKQRKDFSTGIRVNPDHWDPKKQRLLDTSPQEETTNMQLSLIEHKISKAFLMLKNLEKQTFEIKRLEVIKDCFVFCCYTGLAFKEMSCLKKEHIVKGFDGMDWIKIKRQKTLKTLSIPLLPKAKKIIRKYQSESDYVLPVTSNARFNGYLKEIADVVGIKKRLTHHVARRAFASTVLLYNNVPMEVVSELLGHTKLATTQQSYGKIVQRKVGE